MALSDEDVREILRIIDESGLDELHLVTEGFVLHVLRGETPAETADSPPGTTRGGKSAVSPGAPVGRGRMKGEATTSGAAGAPGRMKGEATTPPTSPSVSEDDGAVVIAAPMLGTFYRAESPGEAPFVEVGSRVQPDTTVCIIEVMKMMNSVPAGVAGTIVEVCLENAGLVESGAPMFRVRPDSDAGPETAA
jgi:acetyl-CoA carboxylase biotin carboxyl carrier protein